MALTSMRVDDPDIVRGTPSTSRILLELGRGGMGVVYLAVDESFGKLKVIKRLRPDLRFDGEAVRMFIDEARLCARMNHPNVVQTSRVDFDGAHPFMEMEWLEGQPYDAFLSRAAACGVEVPLEVSLGILADVLAGLHHAHELTDMEGRPLAVVHRDVSPHNVMVTFDGAVKVVDFGIAKAVTSRAETQAGVVKGKVTYMSPEQAARRPVD